MSIFSRTARVLASVLVFGVLTPALPAVAAPNIPATVEPNIPATVAPVAPVAPAVSVGAIPANTAAPVVSGTRRVPNVLTVSDGTWSGVPTSYTRQWIRCSAKIAKIVAVTPATCLPISGATTPSYTLTGQDAGKFISVIVGAINTSGAKYVIPIVTTTVVPEVVIPVNTTAATVSGTAQVSRPLTATDGIWAENPTSYTYQWMRCSKVVSAAAASKPSACIPISGATSNSYQIQSTDLKFFITLSVTGLNTAGSSVIYAKSTSAVTASTAYPPSLSKAPTMKFSGAPANLASAISGSPMLGSVLVASKGQWLGFPLPQTTYSYWYRCDVEHKTSGSSRPADCYAISGSDGVNGETYLVTSNDVGKFLAFEVIATNESGTSRVFTASSGVVLATPTLLEFPYLSGSETYGKTITATRGNWSVAPGLTLTYTYDWFRCASELVTVVDGFPENCDYIDTASSPNYELAEDDLGSYIIAAVTVTNPYGETVSATTDVSGIITTSPIMQSSPTVSGNRIAGAELRITNGTWIAYPSASVSYQWSRCTASITAAVTSKPVGCIEIPGEQSSTYIQTSSDAGKYLTVAVTSRNLLGSASIWLPSTVVSGLGLSNGTAPSLSGNTQSGSVLSVNQGQWSGFPNPAVTTRWYRCNTAVSDAIAIVPIDCSLIPLAFATTYTLTKADEGFNVTALISATNPGEAAQLFAPSVGVTVGKVTNTVVPVVSGSRVVGSALSSTSGTWTGFPSNAVSYQWFRCVSAVVASDSANLTNCAAIDGATSATYTQTADDRGKYVTVSVTKANDLNSVTKVVGAALITSMVPTTTVDPVVTGVAQSGMTLTASLGTWIGFPAPSTPTIQWYRCTSSVPATVAAVPTGCAPIGGATTLTYLQTSVDEGKYVVAGVSSTNTSGTAVEIGPSVGVTVGEVTNTVVPVVSGSRVVGSALSSTSGTWTGYPSNAVSYQWFRCVSTVVASDSANLTNCAAIDGATSATYTQTADDRGKYVTVSLTKANDLNSVTKVVAAALITTMDPTTTVDPVVTGVAQSGMTLTASLGTWIGFPAPSVPTIQWYRCTSSVPAIVAAVPIGCTPIGGATASTYAQTALDEGKYVVAGVSSRNSGATSIRMTSSTAATYTMLSFSASPIITGTRVVGQRLSTTTGTYSGYPSPSINYQWYRCVEPVAIAWSTKPGVCDPIVGATASSYLLISDDAANYVTVSVTLTNSMNSVMSGLPASVITAMLPTAITTPVISGTTQSGSTLSVTNGEWVGYPTPASPTFKWYRCTANVPSATTVIPATCAVIAGATNATYALTASDEGKHVSVLVGATSPTGTTSILATTLGITNGIVNVSVAPVLSGVFTVGQSISVSSGTWTGYPTPSAPTFKWFRCDSAVSTAVTSVPAGCNEIDGATASSYTLTIADSGRFVVAASTRSNLLNTVTSWSASTNVTNQAVSVFAEPALSGSATNGGVLTVGAGVWNGYPSPAFAYTWYQCTSEQPTPVGSLPAGCTLITGQTASTFTQRTADEGKHIIARVLATNVVNSQTRFTASIAPTSGPVTNTSPPVVSGTRNAGNALTASAGSWTGFPSNAVTYQWYRCATAISATATVKPTDCVEIIGATSSSRVLSVDDSGSFVTAAVTKSNELNSLSVWGVSGSIVGMTPDATSGPSIAGTARSGSILTVDTGSWRGFPATISTAVQWHRCTTLVSVSSSIPITCSSISGATSTSYIQTTLDEGKFVTAVVTAANSTGSAVKVAATSTLTVGDVLNTVAPSVTGNRIVGGLLSATSGTWTGFPSNAVTFQWYRCDTFVLSSVNAKPDACSAISGQTASTYTQTTDDSGKFVTIAVTKSNDSNTVAVWAVGTLATNRPPLILADPIVSGTLKSGSTISASSGTWAGFPEPSFSYAWYACSFPVNYASDTLVVAGCAVISAATSASYTLLPADEGKYLIVRVTASNSVTSAQRFAASIGITNGEVRNSVAPAVTATSRLAGGVLTASIGTWTGYPIPSAATYRWYRCSEAISTSVTAKPETCAEIFGSTTSTYTQTSNDIGSYLAVGVTKSNEYNTLTAWSVATATTNRAPSVVTEPAVSGTLLSGSVLTVDPGSWNGFPAPTYLYQWYSCTAAVAFASATVPTGCAVISGATSATFTQTSAQEGKHLLASVTVANVVTAVTRFTVTTGVTNGVVRSVTAPSITGSTWVNGSTLTVSAGSWSGFPALSIASYQWYRCSMQVSTAVITNPDGCERIDGANASSYAQTLTDVGAFLTASVTRSNDLNTVTVWSVATSTTNRAPSVITDPSVSGTLLSGSVLTVDPGSWNGFPTPTYSYQWYSCTSAVASGLSTVPVACSAISGATSSTFTQTTSQEGRYVVAKVTATNAVSALASVTASVGITNGVVANTAAPVVSGTRTTGSVLTSTAGLWSGFPSNAVSYQWFRCSISVGSGYVSATVPSTCVAISGATASTYVQTENDAGFYVHVVVTKSNNMNAVAIWGGEGWWTIRAPSVVTEPSVSGTLLSGSVLTVDPGTWNGFPTPTYSYQWYSCTSPVASGLSTVPATCAAISGATSSTFTQTPTQWAKYVVATVTAWNSVASAMRITTSLGLTKGASVRVAPAVTGPRTVGTSLTVALGSWNGSPSPTGTLIQWFRCTSPVDSVAISKPPSCAEISGQIGLTYVQTVDDAGAYVVPGVTALGYALPYTVWPSTVLTTNRVPSLISSPIISGIPQSGLSLSVETGTWTGFPTSLSYSYKWYSCPSAVSASSTLTASCAAITGASLSSYTPTVADEGLHLIARVQASNATGGSYAYSASSGVTNGPVANTVSPLSTGTRSVGSVLTSTAGTWTGFPANAVSYQWFRCSNAVTLASTSKPDGCVEISGASSAGYTQTVEDSGNYVLAAVTKSNDLNTVTVWPSLTLVTNRLPANVSVPSVSGTRFTGSVLTTDPGVWAAYPQPRYWYQWWWCTSPVVASATLPSGCDDLLGATSESYTQTIADEGRYLIVQVTAQNTAGSTNYYSGSVSVTDGPIANRAAPVVSGTWVVGSVLGSSAGTWTGFPSNAASYQWFRCSNAVTVATTSKPDGCVEVSGATSATYTQIAADAGHYLSAAVTKSNMFNTLTTWSVASTTTNRFPAIVTFPIISGIPQSGLALSVETGTWTGFPTSLSYSYQWYSCPSAVSASSTLTASCAAITGASLSSYTPTVADEGLHLIARVKASNATGGSYAYSASSGVTNGPVANTVSPRSTGTRSVGSVLTSTAGTWTGFPANAVSYQWFRCSNAVTLASTSKPDGCVEISGASSAGYTQTVEDSGNYVLAAVTKSNDLNTVTVWPSLTLVTNRLPANVSVPSVSGTRFTGSVLTTDPGVWAGFPAPTFAFQWYRCTSPVATSATLQSGCTAMSGATSESYTQTVGAEGRYVVVGVTATNSVGSVVSYSGSLVVTDGPVANVVTPNIQGFPRRGVTLTATAGTWSGWPVSPESYQWFRCTTAIASATSSRPDGCVEISGATSATYAATVSDVGFYLSAAVTKSNKFNTMTFWSYGVVLIS